MFVAACAAASEQYVAPSSLLQAVATAFSTPATGTRICGVAPETAASEESSSAGAAALQATANGKIMAKTATLRT